jgi:hypothetical protein
MNETQEAKVDTAGGTGPIVGETPPTQAPPQTPEVLPVSPENLLKVVNAQTEAINTMQREMISMGQSLRGTQEALGSLMGLKNQGQVRTNASTMPGHGPPQIAQEAPEWLKPFIPVLAKVVGNLAEGVIGGKPASNTAADMLIKRLGEYQTKKMDAMFGRIITAIDADEKGELFIGKPPEPPKDPVIPK